ncbi:hypothetical protein [Sphingomonas melonis]
MILAALALLGLWLWVKNREDNDIDDGDAPALVVEDRPFGFHKPLVTA